MADNYEDLYSCTVLDEGGSRIGAVSQVYLDDATGEPTFVTARAGLFGNKEVLVPLVGAFVADDLMQVPHPADVIKQAPAPRPDRRLSPTQEAEVYRHYGLPFTIPDAEQTHPAQPPASVREQTSHDPQDPRA